MHPETRTLKRAFRRGGRPSLKQFARDLDALPRDKRPGFVRFMRAAEKTLVLAARSWLTRKARALVMLLAACGPTPGTTDTSPDTTSTGTTSTGTTSTGTTSTGTTSTGTTSTDPTSTDPTSTGTTSTGTTSTGTTSTGTTSTGTTSTGTTSTGGCPDEPRGFPEAALEICTNAGIDPAHCSIVASIRPPCAACDALAAKCDDLQIDPAVCAAAFADCAIAAECAC